MVEVYPALANDNHTQAPGPAMEKWQSRTRTKVEQAGRGLGRLLVSGSIGLAAASLIASRPVDLDIGIPGIESEVEIQRADYSSLEYGIQIGSDTPNSSIEILGQKFGVKLTITELDVTGGNEKTAQSALDGLIGNTSETLDAIKESAEPAIKNNLLAAGGIGFGFGSLSYLLGKAWRKKRHRDEANDANRPNQTASADDAETDNIDILVERWRERAEDKETIKHSKNRRQKLARKFGSTAVGGLLIASSFGVAAGSVQSITPSPVSRHYVGDALSENDLTKELAGVSLNDSHIFITGDAGYLFEKLIGGATNYTNSVGNSWKNSAKYVSEQIIPQLNNDPIIKAWRQNQNITSFANISDIHDNQAELKYFLPEVIKALQPDFVINSGDQESSSGTIFTDAGAWQRNVGILPTAGPDGQPTIEVLIPGNHDGLDSWKKAAEISLKNSDGTEYHPVIVPSADNGYTIKIDGLTIVGGADLNQTMNSGTQPSSRDDQMKNDAKLGGTLAETACKIAQETGQKPIIVAHEQQATYESLAKACVSLALSGHTHQDAPLMTILNPDGSVSYQKTIGSSSGNGKNTIIGVYSNPAREGELLLWFFDKATNQPAGYVSLKIGPGALPSLEITDLSKPSNLNPKPIDQYNVVPGFLSKCAPPAN